MTSPSAVAGFYSNRRAPNSELSAKFKVKVVAVLWIVPEVLPSGRPGTIQQIPERSTAASNHFDIDGLALLVRLLTEIAEPTRDRALSNLDFVAETEMPSLVATSFTGNPSAS